MADITLNSAVRSNLRVLQSTTDLLSRTQERLSTGKKVNSALDNPASFFTAQALDRRSSDLSSLLDNVSSSVKTIEAADNGISAITKVVESLKATARSALQSPSAVATKANVESGAVSGLTATNLLGDEGATAGYFEATGAFTPLVMDDPNDAFIIGFTVDGVRTADVTIDQTNLTTVGNNDDTLDNASELNELFANAGLTEASASIVGGKLRITSNTTGAGSSVARARYTIYDGGATMPVQQYFFLNPGTPTQGTSGGANDGKTLIVKDRSGADKTVTLSNAAGANNVSTLAKLNDWFEANDVALTASVSTTGGSGKLKISAANTAANFTPADLAGTMTDTGGAFAADKTFSAPVLDTEAAARRASFVKDYNDALKQISSLAKDASFNGVNLLSGDDLDVTFNETGSSRLNVRGATFDAAGLGFADLANADFYDSDSIGDALDTIESAFGKLEQQASKFGSQLQIVNTRESFTKAMIGTLDDGSLALTGADNDLEAANLATLKTRQQLIVSALSISTSQESNVLQLLR